jgi:hypothetical protein
MRNKSSWIIFPLVALLICFLPVYVESAEMDAGQPNHPWNGFDNVAQISEWASSGGLQGEVAAMTSPNGTKVIVAKRYYGTGGSVHQCYLFKGLAGRYVVEVYIPVIIGETKAEITDTGDLLIRLFPTVGNSQQMNTILSWRVV